jgi:hypothetical protein
MTKHEHSRRFADKSTKAGREFIEKGVSGAEEATKHARQSFSSSIGGVRELNITLIEMAHANTEAVFDLAHEIWRRFCLQARKIFSVAVIAPSPGSLRKKQRPALWRD